MIKVEIIEGEQMKANRGEKEILGMDLLSFFHVFDFSILGLLLLITRMGRETGTERILQRIYFNNNNNKLVRTISKWIVVVVVALVVVVVVVWQNEVAVVRSRTWKRRTITTMVTVVVETRRKKKMTTTERNGINKPSMPRKRNCINRQMSRRFRTQYTLHNQTTDPIYYYPQFNNTTTYSTNTGISIGTVSTHLY